MGIFISVLVAALLASGDNAVIVDSGSTNRPGFRIGVSRSGQARSGDQTRQLANDLSRRFFRDLEAARPFSALPRGGCMKSASFGTTRTIEFHGQVTPDLSCGSHGNASLQNLIQDTGDIVAAFSVAASSKE